MTKWMSWLRPKQPDAGLLNLVKDGRHHTKSFTETGVAQELVLAVTDFNKALLIAKAGDASAEDAALVPEINRHLQQALSLAPFDETAPVVSKYPFAFLLSYPR